MDKLWSEYFLCNIAKKMPKPHEWHLNHMEEKKVTPSSCLIGVQKYQVVISGGSDLSIPCFNTSWIGNDLFLFLCFLGKIYIFHLFKNVFITSI